MLQIPTGSTRPSHARLRQALFNSIQMKVSDSVVLDLFAGSGALGFEALSRGAKQVDFVEIAPSAAKVIEQNCIQLGVRDQCRIIRGSADQIREKGPYDLVFADPPYAENWEIRLLETLPWSSLLAPGGLFVLEWGVQKSKIDSLPERQGPLLKIREKNYGDSALTTYALEPQSV